jgi:hypothetical protein
VHGAGVEEARLQHPDNSLESGVQSATRDICHWRRRWRPWKKKQTNRRYGTSGLPESLGIFSLKVDIIMREEIKCHVLQVPRIRGSRAGRGRLGLVSLTNPTAFLCIIW